MLRGKRLNCSTHIVESSRSVDVHIQQKKEKDNAVNNLILTISLFFFSLLSEEKRKYINIAPEASYRCFVPAAPIHLAMGQNTHMLYENRNRWIKTLLIKGTKPNHSGFEVLYS